MSIPKNFNMYGKILLCSINDLHSVLKVLRSLNLWFGRDGRLAIYKVRRFGWPFFEIYVDRWQHVKAGELYIMEAPRPMMRQPEVDTFDSEALNQLVVKLIQMNWNF